MAMSLPDSPAGAGTSLKENQSHEFRDSPFKGTTGADSSSHAKEVRSNMGGTEISGDKSSDAPGWGTFDTHYDTESVWGSDSVSGKELDHDRHSESLFGVGEFALNPTKTGPSHADNIYQGKITPLFADSVSSTPAYDQGRSLFADSVPSTPAYNKGKSSSGFADSVPSIPACNQGMNSIGFEDSVPSTSAHSQGSFGFADSVSGTHVYNFGSSPWKFNEGSEDHSFDSFSRFDSFSVDDSGLFQSPRHSFGRFDSMNSSMD